MKSSDKTNGQAARVQILDVGGDMNASGMVRIRNRIERLVRRDLVHMVLDVHKARHVDLAGLGILAESLGWIRYLEGDLVLAGARPSVRRIFQKTGTDKLMQVYNGVRAAVRSFSHS
ncbi:MAG: STAS domain-containing protein [Candidatus Omnitrophica bacterium]|nr:STAS domain-containing protein [Candidatus Omnitrophota bacterium]